MTGPYKEACRAMLHAVRSLTLAGMRSTLNTCAERNPGCSASVSVELC